MVKASGAARRPRIPINGARACETAVPRASPTQTKVDQETCLTRSAAIGLRPGKIPNPAAKSRSRASITKPRSIASHAVRKSVAPRPAAGGLSVAAVDCCGSFTVTPGFFFLGNAFPTTSPETPASSSCITDKRIFRTERPRKAPRSGGAESPATGRWLSALVRHPSLVSTAIGARQRRDTMTQPRVASNLPRLSAEPRA